MTEIQYRRWKNFAIRMARRGFDGMRRSSAKRVGYMVKEFFRQLDADSRSARDNDPDTGIIERIRDWDRTDPHPTLRDEHGHGTGHCCVGDMVSIALEENLNPYLYHGSDRDYQRWDDLWGCRVRCCLRAGLDVACAPSMGVIGFCAGDLRRMWRGKPPEWVTNDDEHWEKVNMKDIVPGVGLLLEKSVPNGTFSDMPDSANVYL